SVGVVDAFEVVDCVFGIRLGNGASDLPEKGDGEAVDFVGSVVEDGEVGEHEQFVADFCDDAFGGAGSGLRTLILTRLRLIRLRLIGLSLIGLTLRDGCGGKGETGKGEKKKPW